MKINKIVIFVVIFSLTACADSNGVVHILNMKIPSDNILNKAHKKRISGKLEYEEAALVLFERQLKKAIPTYDIRNNSYEKIGLHITNQKSDRGAVMNSIIDSVNNGAKVVDDPDLPYLRVYNNYSNSSWSLISSLDDPNGYEATCSKGGYPTKVTSCQFKIYDNDIEASYELRRNNFKIKREVETYIIDQLESWTVN